MGRLVGLAAAAVCVYAGIYLLQYNAVSDPTTGTSWFQIIGHGMGIYFIGKGLFVAQASWANADQAKHLAALVKLATPVSEPGRDHS